MKKAKFTYRTLQIPKGKVNQYCIWAKRMAYLSAMEEIKKDWVILRGEIWSVDLCVNVGSEQNKIRPCIIVQNPYGNIHSTTTIVLPISSKTPMLPTQCGIQNIIVSGSILGEQPTTISKGRLGHKICRVSDVLMDKIDDSLRVSLGLIK